MEHKHQYNFWLHYDNEIWGNDVEEFKPGRGLVKLIRQQYVHPQYGASLILRKS